MKLAAKLLCIITCIVAICILNLGCGGRSRHVVTIGDSEGGSLDGLQFIPPDHSRYVDTDTDPIVYWVYGKPPAQFVIALKRIDEDGDYKPVQTKLEHLSGYRWKIKPVGGLHSGTFYAIIVRTDTEIREAWFMTESYNTSLSLSGVFKQPQSTLQSNNAGDANQEEQSSDGAQFEHRITITEVTHGTLH